MQRHYCEKDRAWLEFEHQCNWCGMTEDEAKNYKNLDGDKLLQEIMYRVTKNRREITDD